MSIIYQPIKDIVVVDDLSILFMGSAMDSTEEGVVVTN